MSPRKSAAPGILFDAITDEEVGEAADVEEDDDTSDSYDLRHEELTTLDVHNPLKIGSISLDDINDLDELEELC